MIKEAFGTGSTLEEAQQAAVTALAAPADADVKFDIIDHGKKKTLGLFGGSPAKVRAYYEESGAQDVVDYLVSIIKGMGLEQVKAEFTQEDNDIAITLDCGDDYGVIIGRRGETLDSIQYLTRLAANRICKESVRVSINVGNYREKRENTLRELAAKNAAKVLKYGRNVTFEPMNPYERRIIHTAVQAIEGVTSHSVGSDSERRVVISLEEGVEPTNPSGKGGSRSGGKGNRQGGRGGYRNGSRSKNDSPKQAPNREPRTDEGAQKVSLYGKIN